jgi:hypothetical protein
MNTFKFLFLGLLSFGFSTQVYGKTIEDVVSASCTSKTGFLTLDTAKVEIIGQFGTLDKMVGGGEVPVELIVDYPQDGYTALGSLAIDSKGYWGNLSLLSPTTKQLQPNEIMEVFFTDMEGNAIVESMDCDLVFK